MLPTRLCYDLTSLNPLQDRLALVCEMLFSAAGELLSNKIYRAWVNNHCQLAYDAVSAWLEGQGPLPAAAQAVPGMVQQLQVQDQLAQKLRVRRHQQGALEFESFQPRAQFEDEQIVGLDLQAHNRARQLIEELMVATNGCTARFLGEHGGASIRRVVRSPERWQAIVEVAKSHGFDLPRDPDGRALEVFLAKQHKIDPLRFPDLSLVIIKLMGSGEYVVERNHRQPIGHFGLAVRDYTHSTAPNRRYPDVITLRMIKSILAGQPRPYSDEELNALAVHCTRQEDASRKVERQMRKSEAAMLLQHRIGQFFNGVVTGVSDKGSWVRVFDPPTEGKLVGHLPPLRVGQKLRVKLVTTNVDRGFIDFVVVNHPG
jgi:exoribonuclease-2